MAAFEYVALSADRTSHTGLIEGDSERQARRQLRERGLVPVSVSRMHAAKQPARTRRTRLKSATLALLTRLLATLLKSGLPLDDALLALSRQSAERRTRGLVLAVRSGILEGQSLARSMERFPQAFPDAYRATVAAGEQTRHLPLVLERLAAHVEESARTRQKLKVAMIYPAVLTGTALLVVGGLLTFVVPEIVRVFDSVGQQLPMITRWLMAISGVAKNWGGTALLAIIAATVGFRRLLRWPQFRAAVQRFCMRLPVVGALMVESATAQFARTLAVLLDSGVDLVESLTIAGQATSLLPFRDFLSDCATSVREGVSLSNALATHKLAPPLLVHLVANGEGSGDLAKMLDTAADSFEQNIANSLTIVAGLLEPALILVMGAIVLFIVLAILLPIFDMNQLI